MPDMQIVLTITPAEGVGHIHQQVTGLDWEQVQDVLHLALQQARASAVQARQTRLFHASGVRL
jgi:hypothetical protein